MECEELITINMSFLDKDDMIYNLDSIDSIYCSKSKRYLDHRVATIKSRKWSWEKFRFVETYQTVIQGDGYNYPVSKIGSDQYIKDGWVMEKPYISVSFSSGVTWFHYCSYDEMPLIIRDEILRLVKESEERLVSFRDIELDSRINPLKKYLSDKD